MVFCFIKPRRNLCARPVIIAVRDLLDAEILADEVAGRFIGFAVGSEDAPLETFDRPRR